MYTSHLQDSRFIGKGRTDGFFGGYRYFECDQDCAVFVSLDKLAAKPPHQVPHVSIDRNPYNLAVGSTVQVASVDPNNPPHYGVIRWTGRVAGVDGQVAGIELVSFIIILNNSLIVLQEEYMNGCTDGTFKATGEKYFTCAFGHGLYFPLASLRPDERSGLQAGHAITSPVLGNRE